MMGSSQHAGMDEPAHARYRNLAAPASARSWWRSGKTSIQDGRGRADRGVAAAPRRRPSAKDFNPQLPRPGGGPGQQVRLRPRRTLRVSPPEALRHRHRGRGGRPSAPASRLVKSRGRTSPPSCGILASRDIRARSCEPHIAPTPIPPCASDTVMQCMHEIVYMSEPMGWSAILRPCWSTRRCPASGTYLRTFSARRMPASRLSGRAWSCTASNAVTRSNSATGASSSKLERSRCTNTIFRQPARRRQRAAKAIGSSQRSYPTNWLFGKRSAIVTSARPCPQPTSSTLMPSSSLLRQSGYERQDAVEDRRHHGVRAFLRHHLVKARICRVRHAAALLEALDDAILDAAEHADELR